MEKIKTIVDAYMCAISLNKSGDNHAHKMVLAAKKITAYVEEIKNNKVVSDLTFDIRIGINSGLVEAGLVGSKKFAYDIWRIPAIFLQNGIHVRTSKNKR